MLARVIRYLACPHCGAELALGDGAVRCTAGHSFDVARQGYVNLLPGDANSGTADTAAMVQAREHFLGAGHYRPIERALTEAAQQATDPGCIVDLGAGTGHYLAQVLDHCPERDGLALDISKYALRRAARAHPRMAAAVCDAWRPLPVRTGAAALVLNVFAPRHGAELRRILRQGGTLLVVSPTARHLTELVSALGLLTVDEDKQQRLDDKLSPHLTPVAHASHEWSMSLTHKDIETVIGMGPNAWHTDQDALRERLADRPEPVQVTASVTLSSYRRDD